MLKLTHALMLAVRYLPDDALGVQREVMALDKSRSAIRLNCRVAIGGVKIDANPRQEQGYGN
jgi:hypothetical protein